MKKYVLTGIVIAAVTVGLLGCGQSNSESVANDENIQVEESAGTNESSEITEQVEDSADPEVVDEEPAQEEPVVPEFVTEYMTSLNDRYYIVNFPETEGGVAGATEELSYESREFGMTYIKQESDREYTCYKGYVEVVNTGTKAFKMSSCKMNVCDENGSVLMKCESGFGGDIYVVNEIVAPGEVGYFYYDINLSSHISGVDLNTVTYSTDFNVKLSDENYVLYDDVTVTQLSTDGEGVFATSGKVKALSPDDESAPRFAFICYDADGNVTALQRSGCSDVLEDGAWDFWGQSAPRYYYVEEFDPSDIAYVRLLFKNW